MMPIKKILAEKHSTPRPPVLVIDEKTIKCTVDAGPVCGCDEKYHLIQQYKPFTFGGVHPYNRRKIPGAECLKIYWMKLKIGTNDFLFEKPVAVQETELPENFVFPKPPFEDYEELMLVRQLKYTDCYVAEKLKNCKREPLGCVCSEKPPPRQHEKFQ